MRYRIQLVPLARRQRPGYPLTSKSITVHNTANPNATADNHADYLESADRRASWHICVDDIEAVLSIPLDEQAWHTGTNAGNTTSIGIEVCEFTDKARQDKAIANAQELIASMLNGTAPPEFRAAHLDIADVRTHQSWMQYGTSGKYCPRVILDRGWSKFTDAIKPLLAEGGMQMYFWLIFSLFASAQEAESYAAWCRSQGIAAIPSGGACIAHGNDDKSRKAEAEAEKRGGVCPFGRIYTTQKSYKHFSRRTPFVPDHGDSDANERLADYESRFDRIAASLAVAQEAIPK